MRVARAHAGSGRQSSRGRTSDSRRWSTAEVADRFLKVLARDYFPRYAVVAWTTPAQVVRAAKYV